MAVGPIGQGQPACEQEDEHVVLSPWPTADPARANAIATLKAALGGGVDDNRVIALGSAASALVEKYSPGAPQAIKNEATIRTSGYLQDQPAAATYSETVGPLSIRHASTHTGALRHSGSMSLLSPWKVRRGGAI